MTDKTVLTDDLVISVAGSVGMRPAKDFRFRGTYQSMPMLEREEFDRMMAFARAIEAEVLAGSAGEQHYFEVNVKFGAHRVSYVASQERIDLSVIDLARALTNQAIDAAISAGKSSEVQHAD